MSLSPPRMGVVVIFLAVLSPVLASCSQQSLISKSDAKLDYVTFGITRGCTLNYAREPEIRLCVSGAGGSTLEKAKGYSKRALLMWFRALRQIDDKVSSNVVFSCNAPHLSVRMVQGSGTSTASCGSAQIYTSKTFGTYLHEFGHAVAALGDTYVGGSAGSCQSGQPKSIMCWGAFGPNRDADGFSLLYQDDVNGIQAVYKRIMASRGPLTAPADRIDPLASLDPDNPWPAGGSIPGGPSPEGNRQELGNDIFLAAVSGGSTSQPGQMIKISTRANLDQVVVCPGHVPGVEACNSAVGGYPVQFLELIGERKIYSTTVQPNGADAFELTIFAGSPVNGKFVASDRKTVRFSR